MFYPQMFYPSGGRTRAPAFDFISALSKLRAAPVTGHNFLADSKHVGAGASIQFIL
jgi:hypothetical protein